MKRPRCGTYSGYQAHRRRGEPFDQACRDANAAYMREFRAENQANYTREKAANAARSRALYRLAEAHPREFGRLLLDEQSRAEVWRKVESAS